MAWLVIIGSLPIAIVGFLARDLIKGPLRSPVGGGHRADHLGWRDAARRGTSPSRTGTRSDLNLKDALIIGGTQCLALIPGVSRSGATISVGLMRGLDRVTATRFGFLLGIPALVGAGVLRAAGRARGPAGSALCLTLVGTVVSASSSPTLESPGCCVRRRAHHPGLRLVPLGAGRGADHRAEHRRS